MNLTLNDVSSIAETDEENVYIVHCNITDAFGDTYDTEYCTRPDGKHGLNPVIRKWMADNPNFPVDVYVPPTVEEQRASLQSLTSRQLRLGLITNGISLASVQATLEAMPNGITKETALVEWEYATTFNRTHPLISMVGGALGLSEAQIDVMWKGALEL